MMIDSMIWVMNIIGLLISVWYYHAPHIYQIEMYSDPQNVVRNISNVTQPFQRVMGKTSIFIDKMNM